MTSERDLYFRAVAADCELSVIAPLYMGERFVAELVSRLQAALNTVTDDFEIVLIDDGSRDQTWLRIVEAAGKDSRVRGIRLSRNFGQHCALTAGIDVARGRWLVVMDGDLQDRPEDVPKLYHAVLGGSCDVVIARRHLQQLSAFKKLSSSVFNWALSKLGDIETHQQIGNFRIFSRKVADAYRLYREQSRLLPALMARLGFSIGFLNVERSARADGGSTYNLRRLVRLATDAIIANSEKPLRLGIHLGALLSLFAMVLVAWALIRKLVYGVNIDGWTSVFIAVSFFSGVQLSFSGLIAIYVGRIFNETKRRPIYILADCVNTRSSIRQVPFSIGESLENRSFSAKLDKVRG